MLSSRPVMKAMLLAAGIGERMLPLTKLLPKPAIPVLGRPIAMLVLHRLALEGISSAVVNLHHHPDKMRSLLGEGTNVGLPRIFYSHEETIQGTGGGVRRAAEFLRGDETILVRNSDFLADIDLREVTAAHLAGGCTITLVLAPHRPGYTPVEVDDKGRVLSFGGRPPADPARVAGRYLFTGFQLMEPEVLDWIPADRPSDLVRDLYIRLAGEGQICSYIHNRFWWEFGSPAEYLERVHRPARDERPGARAGGEDGPGGADRGGDRGARRRSRFPLGRRATRESRPGARLPGRRRIAHRGLGGDARGVIGPGVELTRAIVAPATEIPAGMRIENALVCPDPDPNAALPPHTERVGELLLRSLAERASRAEHGVDACPARPSSIPRLALSGRVARADGGRRVDAPLFSCLRAVGGDLRRHGLRRAVPGRPRRRPAGPRVRRGRTPGGPRSRGRSRRGLLGPRGSGRPHAGGRPRRRLPFSRRRLPGVARTLPRRHRSRRGDRNPGHGGPLRIGSGRGPALDPQRFRFEMDFFVENYLGRLLGVAPPAGLREALHDLAERAASGRRVFCHRDFHSRNLMIRPDGRLAMVDIQDARWGPDGYDLASLLRDAYVDDPDPLIEEMVERFHATVPGLGSASEFRGRFDVVATQRMVKALGTFGFQIAALGRTRYRSAIPRTLARLSASMPAVEGCAALHRMLDDLGLFIPPSANEA